LLKTGIRRGELASLDVSDVSLEGLSITLKPTAKRSNRSVFFDEEAADALRRWLKARARRAGNDPALFLAETGRRLSGRSLNNVVVRAAARVGLHTKRAPLEERFGPHCCRHWLVTHLLRAGMSREYVKWIRGDAMRESIDLYYHIDPEDVKRIYLLFLG
jgi:integrase/recombinase XerD